MFQAVYDSAWQHPGIAWVAGAPLLLLGLVALLRGRREHDLDPRRRAWIWLYLLLEVEIVLDAWFSGPFSPLAGPGATAAVVAAIVLGDLRYFYLVERQRGAQASSVRSSLRALLIALPVSFIVPVGIQLLRGIDPERWSGHGMYLAYELALFVLALGFWRWRRGAPAALGEGRARYLRRLLAVELVQYALWVLADALIVSGVEVGYLLRIVPNAIYYAAFVPLAALATPAGVRA